MISIIITAYNNQKYIHECLESTIRSCGDIEYEILIGIDNCPLTLKSIFKNKKKYKNIKIIYFPNRNGTYIIRNSLVEMTNFDNILFFDSDDVMKENMISDIVNNIEKFDCIKPMLCAFKDGEDYTLPKFNTPKTSFGEGVFAIKKHVFNQMNGFEPWVCAADSEFNWRLRENNKTFKYLQRVSFYYRRHATNLTAGDETGMRSKLRMKYHILTKNKKTNKLFQPLSEMVKSSFVFIDEDNFNDFLVNHTTNEVETQITDEPNKMALFSIFNKEPNKMVLFSIFNKEPKKIEEVPIREKQRIVSDNPLFNLLKNKEKVTEVNIVTEQRKNIEQIKQKTKRQINDEFNPPKPNRRLDLPRLRF
jgi:glycosyltransferase involved in cell wall biosynthesis